MKLYDTTLRDGMQSPHIFLSLSERVEVLKRLDDFKVDIIELGWPGSSPISDALFEEAGHLNLNAKTAAFGSTKRIGTPTSLDTGLTSLLNAKTDICTIFGKTDPDHVRLQLRASPEENLSAIAESILALSEREVIYDAEHFFDGFKKNSQYALSTLEAAKDADCIVLCDTNGGTLPLELREITEKAFQFLKDHDISTPLGIHTHNDSGCAVANTLIVSDLVEQVQVTLNGVGERTGNADICQVSPALALKQNIKLNCDLEKLTALSRFFDKICSLPQSNERPYVGLSAFSHKGGVHVDALSKGASYEHISPEEVGNSRKLQISDLSGSAAIISLLSQFGISVSKKDSRVIAMKKDVERMESKGYAMASLRAEQRLLVERHFFKGRNFFSLKNWKVITERRGNEFSESILYGIVDGKKRSAVASLEDKGPVASLFSALRQMLLTKYSSVRDIKLKDFKVSIAEPKGENSTVRVAVKFENGQSWETVGLSPNIIEASLEAIKKGFYYHLLSREEKDLTL